MRFCTIILYAQILHEMVLCAFCAPTISMNLEDRKGLRRMPQNIDHRLTFEDLRIRHEGNFIHLQVAVLFREKQKICRQEIVDRLQVIIYHLV